MKTYYVYIASSYSQVLYVGMTNDLLRRMYEHRTKSNDGFTKAYNVRRLVYFEETASVTAAIAREKQIKGWLRRKKISLIESMNPKWDDLAADWFDAGQASDPSLRSG
jgi:putative endonuclease